MAYILFLNPSILGDAGMDKGAVLIATALAAGIGSILMGLIANLPFALAPGMGMNAYFAYTVVKSLGVSWQTGLAAVFVDGLIFLVLSLLPFRSKIIESIPYNIKLAASAAIGFFIAFIGLQKVGIVKSHPVTLVQMGSLQDPSRLLVVFALLGIAAMLHFRIKGAFLWGILGTTLLAFWVPGDNGLPLVSFADLHWPQLSSLSSGFLKMDFQGAMQMGFANIVFVFGFVSLFDTAGTFVGLATKLGWIDADKPTFEEAPKGLVAESLAIMVGALLGTSTTTTYIESAAGIAEGGRTGLTALTTGLCFLLAVFLAPLATLIPVQATAPVLILVGFLMTESLLKMQLEDITEALPGFLTFLLVPLTFNIANGLTCGILSHTLLKVLTGRYRQINPTMAILSVLCLFSLGRH